jgi:ubiquitin-like 1-activating enzyme E1 A
LANEIAKNLVLAGIGSLTILDPGVVSEEDLGAQFFVSEEHISQKVHISCLVSGDSTG